MARSPNGALVLSFLRRCHSYTAISQLALTKRISSRYYFTRDVIFIQQRMLTAMRPHTVVCVGLLYFLTIMYIPEGQLC